MSPFRFEVDIKTIGILGNRPFLVISLYITGTCVQMMKYDRAYKTRRSSPRTPIRPTKPAPPLPLSAGSSYVMDRARNEFVTHVRPKIDRLTKLSTTGFQLAGQSLEQTIHLSKTHSTKIGATISSVVGGYLFDAALDTYHGGRSGHPRRQCRCFLVSAQCPTRKSAGRCRAKSNSCKVKNNKFHKKLKHRMRVTNTPSTINLKHLTTLLPLLFHSSPLQSQKNASIYRRSRRASNINRLRHRCALNVFRVNHWQQTQTTHNFQQSRRWYPLPRL